MQDNKPPARQPVAAGLAPDIIKEIPVAAPGGAKSADEDEDLDNIMRDIGNEVKRIGQDRPKNHWFGRQKKAKPAAKFSARPIEQIKTAPAAPPKPAAAKTPVRPAVQNPSKPASQLAAKPAKTAKTPVGAILLTVIATFGLIAAAYYAYK